MARKPKPLFDPEAAEAARLVERLTLTRGELEQQVAAGVAEQLQRRDEAARRPPAPPIESIEADTVEDAALLAKERLATGLPVRGIATPDGIYVHPV